MIFITTYGVPNLLFLDLLFCYIYDQLGAWRSAAQAFTHRLLSFCKESEVRANQGRVFNHAISGGPRVDSITVLAVTF